jgi:hypothetical protein
MVKLLEDALDKKLHDIGLGNHISWTWHQKHMQQKIKNNKWKYIQLLLFCTVKKTTKRVKKQPTEWENIFANHVSDKGLICKIYKELLQYNSEVKF